MPPPDLHVPPAGNAPPPATEALARVPVQARSRRTLARLRQAAWHLLEEGGPEHLTVTGVARRAGVSVGSFYARFEGRDELLDHLSALALEEALSFWNAATAPPAPTRVEGAGADAGHETPPAPEGAGATGPDADPDPDLVSDPDPDLDPDFDPDHQLTRALGAILDLYLAPGGGGHPAGQGAPRGAPGVGSGGVPRDEPEEEPEIEPPPGARLHALARMDPGAEARLAHLHEGVARGLAPLLPGAGRLPAGGLLTAAALAAAARALALGVQEGPGSWLLEALPRPSVRDAAPGAAPNVAPDAAPTPGPDPAAAAWDTPGEAPRDLLLRTLRALAAAPLPSEGAGPAPALDDAPPSRDSASTESSSADPEPEPQEEIFDVWG